MRMFLALSIALLVACQSPVSIDTGFNDTYVLTKFQRLGPDRVYSYPDSAISSDVRFTFLPNHTFVATGTIQFNDTTISAPTSGEYMMETSNSFYVWSTQVSPLLPASASRWLHTSDDQNHDVMVVTEGLFGQFILRMQLVCKNPRAVC